jgi:hypothetical protein
MHASMNQAQRPLRMPPGMVGPIHAKPGPQPAPPCHGLGRKPLLHGREQGAIEDWRVAAAMDLAAVGHLADVDSPACHCSARRHCPQ